MTTQLAIRLDDADLAALDELAAAEGVSRSEAARQAIRHRADPELADDLADAVGDESTDDMVDPWIATK